jgi:hypothetical protein
MVKLPSPAFTQEGFTTLYESMVHAWSVLADNKKPIITMNQRNFLIPSNDVKLRLFVAQ